MPPVRNPSCHRRRTLPAEGIYPPASRRVTKTMSMRLSRGTGDPESPRILAALCESFAAHAVTILALIFWVRAVVHEAPLGQPTTTHWMEIAIMEEIGGAGEIEASRVEVSDAITPGDLSKDSGGMMEEPASQHNVNDTSVRIDTQATRKRAQPRTPATQRHDTLATEGQPQAAIGDGADGHAEASTGAEGNGGNERSVGHTGAGNPDGDRIRAAIRQKIDRATLYPWEARTKGVEGRPEVIFAINPDGNVAYVRVTKPSGDPLLDDAAIAAVQRGAPYPYLAEALHFSIRFEIGR